LGQLSSWQPTPLEQAEKLEQLRALENGLVIAVADVEHQTTGIDTPEQYREFVKRYQEASPTRNGKVTSQRV
jgi:3-deoxy-manno-octulosonate cytidylyltransferase (CMP-KDO synthetase)